MTLSMLPLDVHLRRLLPGLLLSALAAPVLAAPAAQPLPAALAGLWRVVDSACGGCDPSQGAETGAEVRLAAQGSQNPFGTDCAGLLEVTAEAPEALPALQERLGLPPRWLSGAEAAPARPYRLVCAGVPREVVILLANGALLIPGEASSVLRLQRPR